MPAEPHNDWIADETFFDEGWADMEQRLAARERRRRWWLPLLLLSLGVLLGWFWWEAASPTAPAAVADQVVPPAELPVSAERIPTNKAGTGERKRSGVERPLPGGSPSAGTKTGGSLASSARQTAPVAIPAPSGSTPPEPRSDQSETLAQLSATSLVELLATIPPAPLALNAVFKIPLIQQKPTAQLDTFIRSPQRSSQLSLLGAGGLEPVGFRLGVVTGLEYSYSFKQHSALFTQFTYRLSNYQLQSYLLPAPPSFPSPSVQFDNRTNVARELSAASADNLRTDALRLEVGYRRLVGKRWSVEAGLGADYLTDVRLANLLLENDRVVVLDRETSFFTDEFNSRVLDMAPTGFPGLSTTLAPPFTVNRLRLSLATRATYRIGSRFGSFVEVAYLPQPVFEGNNPAITQLRTNLGIRYRLR